MKLTYVGVTSASQVVMHVPVGKFQSIVYICLLSAVFSITSSFTLLLPEMKNTPFSEMK